MSRDAVVLRERSRPDMPRRRLAAWRAMKPTHLLLVLAAVAAVVLSGCGESASNPTHAGAASTPTSTTAEHPRGVDRTLARSALLQLDDLPVDWTSERHADEVDCPAYAEADSHPGAMSPDFHSTEGVLVSQRVVLLESAADADALIDRLIAQDTVDCLGQRFEDTTQDNGDRVEVGDIGVARLNVAANGDRVEALRITVPLSASGIDVTVYLDEIVTRVDRGVTMVVVGSEFAPPDDDLRARLTGRAAQLLGTALDSA